MLLKCLHSAWCSGGCGTGRVCCPCAVKLPLDGVQGLDEVKNTIHKLYTSLNIDQHQVGVAVWGGVGVPGRRDGCSRLGEVGVAVWGGVGVAVRRGGSSSVERGRSSSVGRGGSGRLEGWE